MRKIVLNEEDIKAICQRIGHELTLKFKDNEMPPVFLGVMKGAIPFLMDLTPCVDVPLAIDYIQIGSWQGLASTGEVSLKRDTTFDLKDRDVVVVEDIIDSGYSMEFLVNFLNNKHHPRSITIVTLLDKAEARKSSIKIDYKGIEVGNEFLMGYGLDYFDLFRNTRYVFIPDMDEVKSWDKILSGGKENE